jgi:hypothetical protein
MLEVNMSTNSSMKDFYIGLKEIKLEHNLHDMEILLQEKMVWTILGTLLLTQQHNSSCFS